jgi:hypothetical protein
VATIAIDNVWSTVLKHEQLIVTALFEAFLRDHNQTERYTIADRPFRATSGVVIDDEEYPNVRFTRIRQQPLHQDTWQDFELSDLTVIGRNHTDPPEICRFSLMLHDSDQGGGMDDQAMGPAE